MIVAGALKPAAALRLVAFAAPIYLWLAIMWVGSASSIAVVIGRRALGEDSPVPLAASMVSAYAGRFFTFLSPFCLVIIVVRVWGSKSKSSNTNRKEDIKERRQGFQYPRHIFGVITRLILQGSIFTGMLICGPFIFLMPVGRQIMGWSPVKGSQRELVGSMLMDLGILGGSALNCFILVPAMFQCLRHSVTSNKALPRITNKTKRCHC